MALEQDLAKARLNAHAAGKDGRADLAAHWTEVAINLEERLNLRDNPWDALKGSPEHDGYVHG